MPCHTQHSALHLVDAQEMFVELIAYILQVKEYKQFYFIFFITKVYSQRK